LICILARKVIWKALATTLPNTLWILIKVYIAPAIPCCFVFKWRGDPISLTGKIQNILFWQDSSRGGYIYIYITAPWWILPEQDVLNLYIYIYSEHLVLARFIKGRFYIYIYIYIKHVSSYRSSRGWWETSVASRAYEVFVTTDRLRCY